MKPALHTLILSATLVIAPSFLGAQSLNFGLDPNAQCQLSPWLAGRWNWTDTLSASVNLASSSSITYDDQAVDGFDQSLTTAETVYRLTATPLTVRYQWDQTNKLGAGIGINNEWWTIRETGYLDFADNNSASDPKPVIRLFFSNNRVLWAIKPALVASYETGKPEASWLRVEASYIPYIAIRLQHELATAAAGYADWDTPLTTSNLQGSSSNSWRVQVSGALDAGIVTVDIDASAEGARYTYDSLAIGGGTAQNDIATIDGVIRLLGSFKGFQIAGLRPQIGISWQITRTQDLINTDSPTSLTNTPKLSIGFGSR